MPLARSGRMLELPSGGVGSSGIRQGRVGESRDPSDVYLLHLRRKMAGSGKTSLKCYQYRYSFSRRSIVTPAVGTSPGLISRSLV